jgi:hypothetical protein
MALIRGSNGKLDATPMVQTAMKLIR